MNGPKRPLRICFLGWGDHVHLERWAGYFARHGHEVSVISVSGKGNYPPGVRCFTLGVESRGLRWKRLKAAYLLWRIRPDIVHVHWAHFAAYLGYGPQVPTVITAWGSDIYRTESFSAEAAARLVDSLKAAAVVTGDSDDLLDQIRTLTGRTEGVSLIQWGVDTDQFCPGEADPAFRRSLADPGQPVILSIRNFTPLYNLETIVDAFALVLREVPHARLVMKKYNAQPDYVEAIDARIAKLGIGHAIQVVEAVPYDQMPDLYRSAQVTVSVPSSDATPMSLLEAMACGSVPIFSDLPSLREWIEDGKNGYLVPPKDAPALAERIVRLLQSPQTAAQFAARNLEIVRARASQAVHMGRMEQIYLELLRRPALAAA